MLRLIAVLLTVWEPLRFALEALMVLPTISYRGAVAAVELVAHGLVAALCAGAGLALSNGAPDGRRLAVIALIASLLRSAQSLYWSVLPNNTLPGDEWLVLGAAVLVSGAAIVIVLRSRPAP